MAYTTIANIAGALNRSLTTDEQTYFTNVLSPGIDAFIDNETETSFGSTATVEVYVNGDGTKYLNIPTMHDITALEIVEDDDTETAVSVDDYRTWPRGKDDKLAVESLTGTWDEDTTYKVSGEMGYKAVPSDIVLIATELAVNQFSNTSNVKSEKVGDWSVTYSDVSELSADSKNALSRYKRLSRSI